MQCIILAAGFGTRLQEQFPDTPKQLIPLNGKAILSYIIDQVSETDVENIYLISNNKYYKHFESWNQNNKLRIINNGVSSNEDRLGSVGDMIRALSEARIDDDVLFIGGDNILEFSLVDFISEFRKHNDPMIAVYDVKDLDLAKHYGIVAVQNNIITEFQEKPEMPKSTLASTFAYLLPRDSLHLFQEYEQQNPDKLDKSGHYIQWLTQQRPTRAYTFDGNWFDIGNFEQLKEAEQYFKTKELKEKQKSNAQ